jgi:predicted amidohydrolase YtcJ
MSWDLWVDYQRRDGEGLTHASVKDVEPGVALEVGGFVVVGNEEADSAVAEVMSIDERGIVLLRVLPGSFDDHRHLVRKGLASAS